MFRPVAARLIVLLCSFLFAPHLSQAQDEDALSRIEPSDKRGAQEIRSRNYIGIEAGITGASLTGGTYTFNFPYPYDDLGRGDTQFVGPFRQHDLTLRMAVGGVLDVALSERFSFQTKLGYRVLGSSGTHNQRFYCFAIATQRGDSASFINNYDLSVGVLTLDMLGKYYMIEDVIYGLGGFGFGGVMYSNASASQEISSDILCQYTFSSGPITNRFISGNDDIDMSGHTSGFRLDLRAGVGADLKLSRRGLVLAPELTVGYPVTDYVNKRSGRNKDDLQLPYFSATLGLKIPFDYFSWVAPPEPVEPVIERQIEVRTDSVDRRTRKLRESGKVDVSGLIYDKDNELIDTASITVVDLITNEVVATDTAIEGVYTVEVDAPGKYSVTADAPGHLFGSAYFEVDKDGRILRHADHIRLSASLDGKVRLLVFFDFDKATLQTSSYPELDRAVALMKADANMEVEIAGYTDAQGTDAYNKDLSQRRANSVREYLVQNGIPKARLEAVGYGETNPIADNETEFGRAENRRVEFVVKRRGK
jgi:outer membrane protein OmpA-like peptidoglycan-associated protein